MAGRYLEEFAPGQKFAVETGRLVFGQRRILRLQVNSAAYPPNEDR
jgi:hypothetical protein